MKTFQHADYTLTWTAPGGDLAIADNIADDDATVIPTEQADHIRCAWDTNGATTNAPDFDFHIEVDIDGTNYSDTHYHTLVSAAPKDIRGYGPLTVPRRPFIVNMDLNTSNLTATEFVLLYVYVYY